MYSECLSQIWVTGVFSLSILRHIGLSSSRFVFANWVGSKVAIPLCFFFSKNYWDMIFCTNLLSLRNTNNEASFGNCFCFFNFLCILSTCVLFWNWKQKIVFGNCFRFKKVEAKLTMTAKKWKNKKIVFVNFGNTMNYSNFNEVQHRILLTTKF